ncbi:extensin, partial [Streptomyces sp. T028]|uniref:extensin n=1 Tax=Streptomyces sp. T028 TaxID=3394379 RepID=UPI003A874027
PLRRPTPRAEHPVPVVQPRPASFTTPSLQAPATPTATPRAPQQPTTPTTPRAPMPAPISTPTVQRLAPPTPPAPPRTPPKPPPAPRSEPTEARTTAASPPPAFDPRALTDFQLDELTHRLTGRITRLLRTELRLDRERIGRLRDPRH